MTASIKRKPRVDVVIVGMGWTGSIMALELAKANLRVVGFERGRVQDTDPDFNAFSRNDELRYNIRTEMAQNLAKETISFRNQANERALPMRYIGSTVLGEGLGGMGAHWSGETYRNALWDFTPKSSTISRYGANAWPTLSTTEDWPVSYAELEPHYDRFEYLAGVSGVAGNIAGVIKPSGNPFEAPRKRDYPNPPMKTSYAGQIFRDTSAKLGFHPFIAPSSNSTQSYQNPEGVTLGPCVYCGMCSRYGCEMGAKASPQTTILPALREKANFELRANSNVLRVNLDNAKRQATGVTYVDAGGEEIFQPADLVILASFVFNNTKLMLLSGIGKAFNPVTNKGGVGKNVAYNALTSVQAFFDDKIFNVFMGAGAMGYSLDDFNADYFDHKALGFVNGGHISVISGGAGPISFRPTPPGVPRWGAEWKKSVAKYYNSTVSIAQHGGVLGYRDNVIDLDPTYKDAFGSPLARLTFNWHQNELKMSDFLVAKSVDIARAMGATHIKPSPLERTYTITRYQTSHNSGGTPFGINPESSALNRYLQSWDVPNVFVLGASAFPHASGNNPTDTVGALTYWAAKAIVEQYLSRPRKLV
jgi:gluconate 2-dehydrogenase alpha chain